MPANKQSAFVMILAIMPIMLGLRCSFEIILW
jgi:hypothetical protein